MKEDFKRKKSLLNNDETHFKNRIDVNLEFQELAYEKKIGGLQTQLRQLELENTRLRNLDTSTRLVLCNCNYLFKLSILKLSFFFLMNIKKKSKMKSFLNLTTDDESSDEEYPEPKRQRNLPEGKWIIIEVQLSNSFSLFIFEGYNLVGKISTNGRANGCDVFRGPRGGEYYMNTSQNATLIGLPFRNRIRYFSNT